MQIKVNNFRLNTDLLPQRRKQQITELRRRCTNFTLNCGMTNTAKYGSEVDLREYDSQSEEFKPHVSPNKMTGKPLLYNMNPSHVNFDVNPAEFIEHDREDGSPRDKPK
jgi:hypothetical protein